VPDFGQVFGQVFDEVFDQGFWTRKYTVRFYRDEENQEQHQKTITN